MAQSLAATALVSILWVIAGYSLAFSGDGLLLGDLGHLIRPRLGQVAVVPIGGDAHGDSAEILDDGQAQHDGHRPQFTEIESGYGLIGRQKTAEYAGLRGDTGRQIGFPKTP